jgi:hypothetical protein
MLRRARSPTRYSFVTTHSVQMVIVALPTTRILLAAACAIALPRKDSGLVAATEARVCCAPADTSARPAHCSVRAGRALLAAVTVSATVAPQGTDRVCVHGRPKMDTGTASRAHFVQVDSTDWTAISDAPAHSTARATKAASGPAPAAARLGGTALRASFASHPSYRRVRTSSRVQAPT